MIHPTTSRTDTQSAAALQAATQRSGNGSARTQTDPTGDSLSTGQTENLRQALKNNPEVRPEVVARGKALAADPSYPSPEIMRRVSELIVNSEDPSEQGS